MLKNIRVLPVLILAAMMLLGIKVVELRRGVAEFGLATALAQGEGSKGEKDKGKKDKGKTAEKAEAAKTKAAMTKAEAAKTPGPMDEPAGQADKTAMSKDGKEDAKKMARRPKAKKQTSFTPAEVEVLQRLSGRREALEQRSSQMAMREKILQATENRIDKKISELKSLEERIKGFLVQHDKETEDQLKSLVKVYENMKPKEAARIFEELEMDILLNVTQRMKEVKMAKVLAAMDPIKAKNLTVKLATWRRLPKTGG